MADDPIKLTAVSCRAARAIAGWGVRELAAKAGVGADTISLFENGRPMRDGNRRAIQDLFEAYGVEILNGDAPGARLRFSEAKAHNLDGVWMVATRWAQGAPLELVSPTTAREAAAEARRRGDERVAAALEAAAADADRSHGG